MKLQNHTKDGKRDVSLRAAIQDYVERKFGLLWKPLESTGSTGGTNG